MTPNSEPTGDQINTSGLEGDEREAARLAALDYLSAIRPEVDHVLQELVDDVRSIFGTDLCMVNLVTADAQYFRAWSGELPEDLAEARQDPRERSMCQYVVETEEPLVVPDFLATEEFHDQYFRVNYGVRFYAGTPLTTSDGHAIGTLCLLHTGPKELDEEQMNLLGAFGQAVVGRIELLGALKREQTIREEDNRHSQELNRQRNLYETLLKAQSEIGEGFVLTEGRRIVYTNEAFSRISGYSIAELKAMSTFFQLIPPEDRAIIDERLHQRLDAQRVEDYQETVIIHKSGRRVSLELGIKVLRAESQPRLVMVVRDITERKRAEEKIRFQARLLDAVGQAVITTDLQGKIIYWNRAAESLYGWSAQEVMGCEVGDILVSNNLQEQASEIVTELRAGRSWSGEFFVQRRDGTLFPALVTDTPVYDEQGALCGIIGISTDITERKALEEQLLRQALHDPLTDLPNRVLFVERLEHALARVDRYQNHLAVLFMDLDNFKVINDSLGHECGDRLLSEVAECLSACLRAEDTLARLGGDEFIVLLEDVADVSEAVQVAKRITKELQQAPFTVEGQEVFITISIGVALSASSQDRPEDLLRKADIAMYRAKNKGKANHAVFNTTMGTRAIRRLRNENDLRRAIEQKELRVFYQPKVLIETGRITDMEALVRWEHPERGRILPAEFIPLAEETGLIVPLGLWVLKEACRQIRHWQEQYPGSQSLTVNVNLSARQFQDPTLVEDIARALEETGLDPSRLELEVTESNLMEHAGTTITTLGKLKGLGVKVAIDDFGTGYSSLSYLKRFPINTLKIDRSFVEGLGEDYNDTVLISGIVSLAHALDLKVIAEGVETADQRLHLREIGCEKAQGFYFSKPLPAEAASALLAKGPLI